MADPSHNQSEAFLGGRVPPQALEIEKAILGAILQDKEAIAIALELIRPEDFYAPAHQKIFAAMQALFEKDQPIDILTLNEELNQRKELEKIGGAAYLAELPLAVPSSANIEQHLKILREKALLRRLIHSCTEILKEAYEETNDVETILSLAQQTIFDLVKTQRERGYQPLTDLLTDTIHEIEKRAQQGESILLGIDTGFESLNKITAGFQPGDLVILAGRPSMGKTAFALNLARNAALSEKKVPVGIFSLEMSAIQLTQRLICMETMIDSQRFRTGRLRTDELKRLSSRVGVLAEAPIFIDDTPGLNIVRLASRARRMALEQNIGMLIIDYLQLMEAHSARVESRQQEIAYISRSLKGLAKQLNIPIIALSQLSRAVESRPDKRPTLADLRESGAIEQDADLVMFVYRQEVYAPKDLPEEKRRQIRNIAEIIIGKHRNGPIGTVKFTFLKQYGRFSELPQDFEQEQAMEEEVDF